MKKKIIIILSIVLILIIGVVGVIFMKKEEDKPSPHIDVDYKIGEFNLNLIKTVNATNDNNYLISPYSIEIALNLLKEGTANETHEELENVVQKRDIPDLTIKDHISVANAAFIKNKYKDYIKTGFYRTIKEKYNSEILYDEFKTPKVINDWVNEKTNGMIDKILDKVDDSFTLGLANALAIDVKWYSQFDCYKTKSQKFTKVDGKNINVEMMHKELSHGNYKYLKDDEAEGVIIPYQAYDELGEETYESDSNLEFLAILPKDNIKEYINNLTTEKLSSFESTAREVDENFEINLSLPRFKYDYELSDFKQVLINMGIKKIFDEEAADFSNIIDNNVIDGNLYVGEAIHKTHIDLSEKGTKAAAVTYFGMYTSGIALPPEEIIDLTFDKPFLYIIRDKNTKEILFFGVVYEPNEWTSSTCSEE